MEIKPDYRFTKLHTSKGTFYSLEIYIGIEESYVGYGKTIMEAVEKAYEKCSIRIDELETFSSIFNEKFKDVNAIHIKNKIEEKEIAEGRKNCCLYCGEPLKRGRRKFCSDFCRRRYKYERVNENNQN